MNLILSLPNTRIKIIDLRGDAEPSELSILSEYYNRPTCVPIQVAYQRRSNVAGPPEFLPYRKSLPSRSQSCRYPQPQG